MAELPYPNFISSEWLAHARKLYRVRYLACSLQGRGCPKMAKAIVLDDLEFGTEPLGMGGSATVYKGRWKSRDMTVAVKTSVQGIADSEV